MTKTMIWVVTPTKLCNLRCSYCYEWNELSNPARMSADLLRRVLLTARDYHVQLSSRFPEVVTNIAWLGGEPLALPVEYLDRIMQLEEEVVGDLLASDAGFYNVVQTNLYSLPEATLEFLAKHRWTVGVSLDVVPGVRLSLSGRETETRVKKNVARLRERGIEPSAITVLARHTAPRITQVYDYFERDGFTRLRVLPLFSGPAERPMENVLVSNTELVDSMCKLFVHWIESGARVRVEPLVEYLDNVLRRMIGFKGRLYDRLRDGEGVLVVNTNGDVYHLLDTYVPELAMGNVGTQTIDEILGSKRTLQTLERDGDVKARVCGECAYAGYCSGVPAIESPRDLGDGGRCAVAHRVQSFMETYLRSAGLTDAELARMLRDIAVERAAAPASTAAA
jgi:uncharacterized protein